jgi:NAD-dependent dihydropyrimidine dehydrogenase PreA subunit
MQRFTIKLDCAVGVPLIRENSTEIVSDLRALRLPGQNLAEKLLGFAQTAGLSQPGRQLEGLLDGHFRHGGRILAISAPSGGVYRGTTRRYYVSSTTKMRASVRRRGTQGRLGYRLKAAAPFSRNRIGAKEYQDVMAHIIAQPCIGVKDTACVTVCPVDCIHPTKDEAEFEAAEKLYIDPDTCIFTSTPIRASIADCASTSAR